TETIDCQRIELAIVRIAHRDFQCRYAIERRIYTSRCFPNSACCIGAGKNSSHCSARRKGVQQIFLKWIGLRETREEDSRVACTRPGQSEGIDSSNGISHRIPGRRSYHTWIKQKHCSSLNTEIKSDL